MDSGKVDGKRLCITGDSAGGYTTLAALAFRDTFKAGASLYGVSVTLTNCDMVCSWFYKVVISQIVPLVNIALE